MSLGNAKPKEPRRIPAAYSEPAPSQFLEIRVCDLTKKPSLHGLCAGFESSEWRTRQLAQHLMEWLPDFALSYEERRTLSTDNAVRRMRKAAHAIYESDKFSRRGEFGELLLHIAIRQVFRTVPAVSKIYYKDSANDTVKGFDAVHVIVGKDSLELWIGEAKFYDDISKAITDVVIELERHTESVFLRSEFVAITNKIDSRWPHAERLRKLLDPNTSLDQVFDVACIPVLLTYDSPAVAAHNGVCEQYVQQFRIEVESHHRTFSSKRLPKVRIHLFLVPLKSKSQLVAILDEELKKWQTI